MPTLVLVDQSFIGYEGHHYEYNMSIAQAAAARGLSVVIAANRRVAVAESSADIRILPWFRHSWGQASGDWKRAENFLDEFLQLIETLELGSDDHLLIHTVSTVEFIELLRFFDGLLGSEAATLPTVHLVSRRDPLEYGAEGLRAVSETWSRIRQSATTCAKCRLYTDTIELSVMHRNLTGVPFKVLPIPFRHALVAERERPRAPGAPLTLLYLGDARLEKGYHLLPDLVGQLWEDWIKPGRIRVVVQSNLNIPGGEPGILQARNKLRQYPFGIEIIDEPMSAERYYDFMANSDIVVLPYDPKAYAGRSSGVLNEALASGKVPVVSMGTWLANQVEPGRGCVFPYPAGLVAGVKAALERFEELAAEARAYAPIHRRHHSLDNFLDMLLADPVPTAPTGASVLFVMDGTAMSLRNGSSMVARNQLRHLLRHGYRVHGLFLNLTAGLGAEEFRRWTGDLREELRGFDLASVWTAGHVPLSGRIGWRAEATVAADRGQSFMSDVRYRTALSLPADLHAFLRNERIDVVLLNYVQNLPLVRRLLPDGVPVVCESHDIQSFQYAIYNDREVDARDLEAETALLESCDHVIAINSIEGDWLSQRLRSPGITYIPQPPAEPPASVLDMAGVTDLAELVASCRPSRGDLAPEWTGAATSSPEVQRLRALGSVDLLYVSSAHRPNIDALRWFVEAIHRNELMPRGISLFIAGSICDAVADIDLPGVFRIGRVDDLAPLYAAARIVLLPMRDGAGSPIKTLEALAHGKPVVATSAAMRGLRFDQTEFPVFDDAVGYGARILDLMRSPQARLAAGRAALRISQVNGNDGLYDDRMATVLRTVLGNRTPAPQPHRPSAAAQAPTEWTPELRALNRLLRAWCASEPFAAEDWRLGAGVLQADPNGCRAVIRRFLVEQTAPILVARRDGGAWLREAIGAGLSPTELEQVLGLPDGDGPWTVNGPAEDAGGAVRLGPGGTAALRIRSVCGSHVRVRPVLGGAAQTGGVALRATLRDHTGAVTHTVEGNAEAVLAPPAPSPAVRGWTVAARTVGSSPATLHGFELNHSFDVRAPAGPAQAVFASGWHPPELVRHVDLGLLGIVWSGPEPESEVILPIFLEQDAEIRIKLASVVELGILDSIRVKLDGVDCPVSVVVDGQWRILSVRPPRRFAGDTVGHHRLRIVLPLTVRPSSVDPDSGENRQIGIAVAQIEVRMFYPASAVAARQTRQ